MEFTLVMSENMATEVTFSLFDTLCTACISETIEPYEGAFSFIR